MLILYNINPYQILNMVVKLSSEIMGAYILEAILMKLIIAIFRLSFF